MMRAMNPPVVVDLHLVNGRRPGFDVYIGRRTEFVAGFDRDSKWCNPFSMHRWEERALPIFDVHIQSLIAGVDPAGVAGYNYLTTVEQDEVTRAVANATKRWGKGSWNLAELTGRTLGCWCKNRFMFCHGDILVHRWTDRFRHILPGMKSVACDPASITAAAWFDINATVRGFHLGIFTEPPYITWILDGKKTIEGRWSVNKVAPFGTVKQGDIVFMKRSSGPVEGYFTVKHVMGTTLDPARLASIQLEHGAGLAVNDPSFWDDRKKDRYASLLWIASPRRCVPFAVEKLDRRAWIVLKERAWEFKEGNLERFL